MPKSQKPYYIVKEVSKMLNLSIVTIRRYIKDKKIKGFYKLGKEWRVEKKDLENFLKDVKSNNR